MATTLQVLVCRAWSQPQVESRWRFFSGASMSEYLEACICLDTTHCGPKRYWCSQTVSLLFPIAVQIGSLVCQEPEYSDGWCKYGVRAFLSHLCDVNVPYSLHPRFQLQRRRKPTTPHEGRSVSESHMTADCRVFGDIRLHLELFESCGEALRSHLEAVESRPDPVAHATQCFEGERDPLSWTWSEAGPTTRADVEIAENRERRAE